MPSYHHRIGNLAAGFTRTNLPRFRYRGVIRHQKTIVWTAQDVHPWQHGAVLDANEALRTFDAWRIYGGK